MLRSFAEYTPFLTKIHRIIASGVIYGLTGGPVIGPAPPFILLGNRRLRLGACIPDVLIIILKLCIVLTN